MAYEVRQCRFRGNDARKIEHEHRKNKKGIIHTSAKKIHSVGIVSGENLEIRIDSFKKKL